MNAAESAEGLVLTGPPDGQRRPAGWPVAAVAVAAALLGVVVGQLWRLLAPRVPIVKVEQGLYFYGEAQPEQAVAADGWLGLLGLVAGVLAAVAVWLLLRHRRGTVVLIALVLGSLAGGFCGWWLGAQLDVAQFKTLAASAPIGARLEAPLSLLVNDLNHGDLQPNVTAIVVAQAFAAALTYTMLAGFAVDPDLRPDPPEPEELGDDGYPEPARPPLAPPPPGLGSPPGLNASSGLNASPGVGPSPGLSWPTGLSSAPGAPGDPTGSPEWPGPGRTG